MTDEKKRLWLFVIFCMGIRALLVLIAKYINTEYLKYAGYLALIPAIGFMVIYLKGVGKTDVGVFGGKIWWNNLRPIHSILYLLFAYSAIMGNTNAWLYLLVDVLIGFISVVSHYYLSCN
jgi:hypothetical protein